MRALIALMLFATTPVVAGDLADGNVASWAGDYQKAFRLWKRSAEQGVPRAQNNLGTMYNNGNVVPEDHAKAVHWFTKAPKYGLAAAQHNLGVMYDDGKGVPEDDAKAIHWFTKAAKQGLAAAQLHLGGQYFRSEGVPEDYVRAYAWLSIAAAQGLAYGKKVKKLVAKRMTPAQIAEAQKLSSELWEKYVVPFQKNNAVLRR